MRSVARAMVVLVALALAMGEQSASARGAGIPRKVQVIAVSSTSVTVAWKPVPRARAYKVVVRRAKGRPHPVRVTTHATTATLAGLKPNVRYSVTVRARRARLGPESVPVTFRTLFPATAVRVAGLNPMAAALDWGDVPRAGSYLLRMSPNADMQGFTDMAFVGSSASIRGLPNNRTFYAQVAAVGSTGRISSDWSPVSPITTPPPLPLPGGPLLTVGSFNVRCENCYDAENPLNEEQPWATRKPVVVAQILSRQPDVVGIQEASQGLLEDGVTPQFKDLRDALNAAGGKYELTNTERYNCASQTGPSCESNFQDNGASLGTRIFYNTDTVTLGSSGSKLLPSAPDENRRYMAWAIFTVKATGKKFFFSTVQTQWMSKYATLRQQEMQVMMNEVTARNPGLPAFVTGDLNSTRYQSPTNAPYDEVIARGFVDPLGHTPKSPMVSESSTAEQRIRANYNSHNNFLRTVSRFAEWQNGSNLDYIFTTPMRVPLWETVLDIDGGDRLIGTIPSDHNMLIAKVALP